LKQRIIWWGMAPLEEHLNGN